MRSSLLKLVAGLALCLVLPGVVLAQDGTITGTVTDAETSEPLPGATVQVAGTSVGTATNVNGIYELSAPSGTQTLQVSFVGYDTVEREVQVEAGETITADFGLEPSAEQLDEVVVTGVSVGTSTQKLGFSVSKVGEEELQQVPGSDPANALRAKTPGARIVQASGQPGTAPSVRLRGTTTLSGSQEPLVVVDGAITAGGLEDIDMQAVQSIEIIKGAAAASLYGSLAGNGVIQVITKRGQGQQDGTTRVTVRNEFGFTQLGNKINLSEHHNRAARDGDGNPITGPEVGGGEFRQECGTPPCPLNPEAPDFIFDNDFSENYDQQDALYDPKAFFTNFVSVASNQGGMNYLLSFENVQNSGIVTGIDPYQRRNIRLNVDNRITDRFEVSASVLYSNSEGFDVDEQGQGANNLFYGALLTFPDLDLDAPAPDSLNTQFNPFTTSGNAANPLYQATAVDRQNNDSRLFGNFQANVDVTDWLSVDGQFSWDSDEGTFRTFTPKGTFPTSPSDPLSPGSLFESNARERVAIAQGRALFQQDFGDLTTNLTAKYAYEDRQITSFSLFGSDFLAQGVPQFDNTTQSNLSPGDFEATIRSEDFVGNLVLDYQDTYIIDAVLRRERVSLFGPEARDATYYRIAGTYRLTQDFSLPYISELKLRGNYGISGSRPDFAAQYETYTVTPSGITKQQLGNRNIQPADVSEYEFGLDAAFLGGRFYFEGTYSSADASNQVLVVPLSSAAGFSSQYQNAATLETSTYEFAAGGQIFQRNDWGVDLGIVFDRTRQTVTQLNRPSFNLGIGSAINIFRIEEGVDLGVMYGNQIATSVDELLFDDSGCLVGETGAGADCLQRGDLTINNEGYVIEDGTEFTTDENPFYIRDASGSKITTAIGDANPDFNMGINATARYKNFSLFTTVDWERGADVYNYTRQLLYFNDRHGDLDQSDLPEEQRRPSTYWSGPLYNQASASSDFVEDASFVKIREISLTYRFTNDLLNRIGLGGTIYDARFSILGRNLFTFTDYTGFDPEVSTEAADQPVNYKFDEFAYPNFRTFSASLEIRL
jgi:TonB-linked SusC/RagA family outer membrane protein